MTPSNRRTFLQRVSAGMAGAAWAWRRLEQPAGAAPAPGRRPNILIITADDLGFETPACFGNRTPAISPNIDRLAAQGVRFEHGYVTCSVCQPSRSVWVTGRYPHRNGAVSFNPVMTGVPMLGEQLRRSGYVTGLVGKVPHYAPADSRHWDFIEENATHHGRDPQAYRTILQRFLQRDDVATRPFCLIVNVVDPHRPFSGSDLEARRSGASLPPAPSRTYAPEEVDVPGYLPDTPEVRRELSWYYNSAKRCDDIVGGLMDVFDGSTFAENTVVMFLGDNGAPLPFAKGSLYRQSCQTPWIVRWPDVVAPGTVDATHFINGIDLMPTVLDMAGAPLPDLMDGTSFLPVLQGRTQPGRDHAYCSFTQDQFHTYPMRARHSRRYGYVFNMWADGTCRFVADNMEHILYRGAEENPDIAARLKFYSYRAKEELYDYEKDPWALRNLVDDPAYADALAEQRRLMVDWLNETRDPLSPALRFYLGRLSK